jgi:hypothetical protein
MQDPENHSGSDLANQQHPTNMDPNMQSYHTNLSQDSQNMSATKFISNQSAGLLAQKHPKQQSENWDSKISDGIYSSVGTQKMAEAKLKEEEAESFNIEEYFDIEIQTCLVSDNRNRNIKIPVYDISFLPKGNPEFSVAESNKQPISIPPSVHALSSRLVKTGIIVNSPIVSKVDSFGGIDKSANSISEKLNKQWEEIIEKEKLLKKEFDDPEKVKNYFTGITFMQFQRVEHATTFLQHYHTTKFKAFFIKLAKALNCPRSCKESLAAKQCYRNTNCLSEVGKKKTKFFSVELAPDPGDIIWHNLGAGVWEGILRRVITLFVCF